MSRVEMQDIVISGDNLLKINNISKLVTFFRTNNCHLVAFFRTNKCHLVTFFRTNKCR